jgi:hypothetical protein
MIDKLFFNYLQGRQKLFFLLLSIHRIHEPFSLFLFKFRTIVGAKIEMITVFFPHQFVLIFGEINGEIQKFIHDFEVKISEQTTLENQAGEGGKILQYIFM